MWFVVDEYYCSQPTVLPRVCKSRPSQSNHTYTALMRANQPETAVRCLPGLLCTHLFPCTCTNPSQVPLILCRRTRETSDSPLVYWTFLVSRPSKQTVLNNFALTSVTRTCNSFLFTTSSSWNRLSMIRRVSDGNTSSSKTTRRSSTSWRQSH